MAASRGLFHLWHMILVMMITQLLLNLGLCPAAAGLGQALDAELLGGSQEVGEVLLVHIDLSMIHEVQDSHHVRKPDSMT